MTRSAVSLGLFCLLGLGAAASAPPRSAPPAAGRIEGAVLISRTLTTRRPRFRIYNEPGMGAVPPERRDTSELQNVIIYLDSAAAGTSVAGDRTAGAQPPAVRQSDESFVPHVLAIVQGTSVEFPNDDDVFHNVFSLSHAKQFDLGRYPRGSSRSVTFNRTGIVQVFCHIHSDMSAAVLVLQNPFFARPDAAGRFTIDDVPPGDYTVVGWHERAKPVIHHIHVAPGQTSTVSFSIPVSDEELRR